MKKNEVVKKEDGVDIQVGQAIDVWAKPEIIRKLFAPSLTHEEFIFFMGMGKSSGANPFKREIWAVKYDKEKPASIFLGRDFYRKIAQRQNDYNGHFPMSVYEKDEFLFDIQKGVPDHKIDVTRDRGELVGAYCLVWKKGIDRPFYVYVSFKEAVVKKKDGTPQSTWKTQPSTQNEKVVEARALKMAWQEPYAGTYSEDEEAIIRQDQTISESVTDFNSEPPMIEEKEEESKKEKSKIVTKKETETLHTSMKQFFGSEDGIEVFLIEITGENKYHSMDQIVNRDLFEDIKIAFEAKKKSIENQNTMVNKKNGFNLK